MKSKSNITQVLKQFSAEPDKIFQNANITNNRLYFSDKNRFEICVANNRQAKVEAYNFIYASYIEREYISPHASKMWYTIFDSLEDTITLVAKSNHQVCGVVTIIYNGKLALPCDELFHNELNSEINQNKRFAEISSLGVDSNLENSTEILTKLFNLAYVYSKEINDTTDFIVTVNPKHVKFYERKLLFKVLSNEKSFEKVGGAPAVLLKLNFEHVANAIQNKKEKDFKRTLFANSIDIEQEEQVSKILQQQLIPLTLEDHEFFFKLKRTFSKKLETVQ